MNCVLLCHRRCRRDGHERLGLLVVASCAFPVDAVGVVGCREDNSEEDEKYCEPAFQLPDTLVLVAAVLAVWPGERRSSATTQKSVATGLKTEHPKNRPKSLIIGTVLLALLCALYCKCGDRIYTTGNGPNRRYNNEQEPLIVEGKPIPPP